MSWTRTKICGITRAEDALAAERAGCDAIGFVFWPESKRFVSLERACEIASVLSPLVTRVGVFVSPSVAEMEDAAQTVGLDAAQLCGPLDYDAWNNASPTIRLIRAVGVSGGDSIRSDQLTGVDDYLLDATDELHPGGTGRTFNWGLVREQPSDKRIWLAGGLNLENIAEAIEKVRPFAVDVSTGVEDKPGIKSAAKIEAFIAMVHAASVFQTRDEG
jgi:phosphoribosylanthranilate isomerase